ncbi:MAG: nucleotidyltransferase domain-containing protein [Deltaproteobacteria bacterium]|nr:nucleotidyltransferase domain-containing protein [Deltaproteobacteria bacterium]
MAQKLFNLNDVIKKYVDALFKAGIHPEQILLYGSYAKGTADEWSDIDLAIISEDFASISPIQRLELLALATRGLKAPIEAIGYTSQEIAERGKDSILWEEIQNNHRVLYKAA